MALPISRKKLKNKLSLTYTSDEQPGFFRKKRGKGFQYLDEENQKIDCSKSLKRIQQLVIPPMWKQVWICKKDNGHLQSTGRDLRKRKQYIYHPDWLAYRQEQKFSKMLEFAKALPTLRRTTEKHLKQKRWNRKKVLALAVKILDEHHIRIGNKQYAKSNGTFGLTTLRRKHIELENGELSFSYKAKSNKYRNVSIDNPRLVKLIKQCSELPGYEVLRYQDEDDNMQSVDSSDVNEYLQEVMGDEFTSKDFRTWAGTSLAVKFYKDAVDFLEANPKKKLEPTLVKMVSKKLGNTLSVCREYYIHPCVLDLVKNNKVKINSKTKDSRWMEAYEKETIKILKKYC